MKHKELDGNTFSAYAYEANSFISADIKEFEEILMMYGSFEKAGNSYISTSEWHNELRVTLNQQDEILQSISITVSKYEGEYSSEKLFFDVYYLVKYINENYLYISQDKHHYQEILDELLINDYVCIDIGKYEIYFVYMHEFASAEIISKS